MLFCYRKCALVEEAACKHGGVARHEGGSGERACIVGPFSPGPFISYFWVKEGDLHHSTAIAEQLQLEKALFAVLS